MRPDRRDLTLKHIQDARTALAHAERAVHQDDLMQAELEAASAMRACRRAEAAANERGVSTLVEIEFYSPRDDPYGLNRSLIVRGAERSIMTGAGDLRYALREYFGREIL